MFPKTIDLLLYGFSWVMITIIGTGHIFRISEQIAFAIKHIWPDAVLVELDGARYKAMTAPPEKTDEAPKIYKRAAEYQEKMAAEYGTIPGSELITAVNAGEMIGSAVLFIDKNAGNEMERVWKEMPMGEKIRYRMSNVKDRFFSKKETVEETLEEFAEDEEKYIEEMRKKFPTLVRILVDERNDHMAAKIREASESYKNIVVVIGDGHVHAVSKMLESYEIRTIRLRDLMNKERMDSIRAELWTHTGERDES